MFTVYLPNGKNTELGTEASNLKGSLTFQKFLKYDDLKDGKWHKLEVYLPVPKTAWVGDVKAINCQLSAHTNEYNAVMWFDDFKIDDGIFS